jgi:hypothetical protein
MGESIDQRDSTAAKTRAELGTMIPEGPTSIAEEEANGGWNKRSPQDSRSGYNPGLPDDDSGDSNDN